MNKTQLTDSKQLNDLVRKNDMDVYYNQDDHTYRTPNNICKKFMHSTCQRDNCPFSHNLSKAAFCKTFIDNGYCPRGDTCNFRHRSTNDYQATGNTICRTFQETGNCPDGDKCPYKHTKVVCRNFMKGFCQLGKKCPNLHQEEMLCTNYLHGFCPKGPTCPFVQ